MKVRALAKPGRYADGNGLYLLIDHNGAKRWLLRIVVQGRRRDIGLGSCRLVTLAEARDKALEYRRIARSGGDPVAKKREAQRVVPTFEQAARIVHQEHRDAWRNSKHVAQWISSLNQYAFPTIGDLRVDHIDTPHVLKVLSPIWLEKPETARRVRQRIAAVLDWAKAHRYRSGDNPVEEVAKALPKQPDKRGHFTALPYSAVPRFLTALRASAVGEPTLLAFEFLILTAARTNEVLGATWDEVDLDAALWTVPAERMKSGRTHRVPLPSRCLEILRCAREIGAGGHFIFPGRSPTRPLSNMVFLMALRRLGVSATPHGFRSAFRDWAAEQTNTPRDVCEMALGHVIANKVEAAYNRSDLFEKRRRLMDDWARHVSSRS
ncbi:MAG: tyrosine-type recombinase/integrase [Rhodospirillales bacterium]|nr:tyrosine-type recombinase/integrase [Rhodospirillales bacterium]